MSTGCWDRGSRSPNRLATAVRRRQVYEYLTSDRKVDITYVDGLVIRFNISSK